MYLVFERTIVSSLIFSIEDLWNGSLTSEVQDRVAAIKEALKSQEDKKKCPQPSTLVGKQAVE